MIKDAAGRFDDADEVLKLIIVIRDWNIGPTGEDAKTNEKFPFEMKAAVIDLIVFVKRCWDGVMNLNR